jgi:type IV pilus assembly protein PilA
MNPGPLPARVPRRGDAGFTLVELLIVMVVVGILAAIAVPALVMQRRKAYEASAKSDVRAITREVFAQFVDDQGPLTVTGSAGTWTMRRNGVTVATGALSEHNVVSPTSEITAAGDFCLSVRNTKVDAQFWTADDVGLRAGDCPP